MWEWDQTDPPNKSLTGMVRPIWIFMALGVGKITDILNDHQPTDHFPTSKDPGYESPPVEQPRHLVVSWHAAPPGRHRRADSRQSAYA